MKALSLLLPALWVLVPVVCAQQTSTKNTLPTGIMTVAKYETLTALLNKDNPQKVLSTSVKIILDPYENGKRSNLIRATYNTVIGPPPPGPQLPYVYPEEADNYLKSLFFDKDLMNEIKALPHWQKQWDDILKKIGIILAANTEYIEVNSILKQSSKKIQHTADSTCFNHKPEDGHKLQILIINFDTMAKKERWCFKDGGLKSSDASLRTTLVHEMGHQYLLANYPDLHLHPDNDKIGKLINGVRYSVHEAFAVYTEYLYLNKLASENIIAPFTFRDFVEDTIKDIESKSKQQPYLSKYGVSPDYMLQFITGLDNIRGKDDIEKYGVLPFNYNLLEQASAECKKWASKKSVPQTTYTYHFVNTSTAGYPATGAITYTLYQSTPDHMASLRFSKSTQYLAEIEKVFNNINNSPNKPTDPLQQRKWEREEHEKVEHLIRKKYFEMVLDYLSNNQSLENIDVPLIR